MNLGHLLDLMLHLDTTLGDAVVQYGTLIYGILFLIVFCETGLVVTPFLPGDSLLFAAGFLAHQGGLSLPAVFAVFFFASVLGDNVNYWIGRTVGPRLLKNPDSKVLKPEYLDKTNAFYRKHGGKTVMFARFVVIIRTFAPFVAGVGRMAYRKYLAYSIGGAALWVGTFVTLGFVFGDKVPEKYFTAVIFGIIGFTLVPAGWHWYQDRKSAKSGPAEHVAPPEFGPAHDEGA